MDKILIFTNENKLSALSIIYSEILADCSPYIKQQVFLLSKDSNSWEAKSDFKGSGIYLVFDNLFDLLLTQSKNDTVYALIHNLPKRANELFELKDHIIRKGHHESGDNIYSPVFDVLIDEDGDKMKRIINILKPLDSEKLKETALRFFLASRPHRTIPNPSSMQKTFLFRTRSSEPMSVTSMKTSI